MSVANYHDVRTSGSDLAFPFRGVLFQISEEWVGRSGVADMESRSLKGSVGAYGEQPQVVFLSFCEHGRTVVAGFLCDSLVSGNAAGIYVIPYSVVVISSDDAVRVRPYPVNNFTRFWAEIDQIANDPKFVISVTKFSQCREVGMDVGNESDFHESQTVPEHRAIAPRLDTSECLGILRDMTPTGFPVRSHQLPIGITTAFWGSG